MKLANLLFISRVLFCGIGYSYADTNTEQSPGGFMESAPVGKYSSPSGTVIEEPLFMDTSHGAGGEIPVGVIPSVTANNTESAPVVAKPNKHNQYPGRFESAPVGKYRNKPESSVFDVPLFFG